MKVNDAFPGEIPAGYNLRKLLVKISFIIFLIM
jgi:hypothetical protein